MRHGSRLPAHRRRRELGEIVLKVSVTNKGTTDATKIHLTPAVSNSWKLANGAQPIDRLAPGETRVVKFWARPTTESGEATFTVTVSHSGEKTVVNEGLIGVCGPRIEATAVVADSVETRWERGKKSMATDGDPATYWHSQYIDANKVNPSAQGNPVLVTSLANVPGTVDIPVAGNGSYLRFLVTSAQADVAKDLADVMSVAELGVRIGRSN